MQEYNTYKGSREVWPQIRLNQVFELRNGYTPSKANPRFWEDGEIPWFRMEDIRKSGRVLCDAIQHITKEAVKGDGLFEAGSFLLATTATIGEHARLIVDSLANQRFTNLKIRKSLVSAFNIEFMSYYMYVIDQWCKDNVNSCCFSSVDMNEFKKLYIPCPPLAEQRAIAAYLDERCGRIDRVVEAERRRIALLNELRQSVITHTVTRGLNPDAPLKDIGVEWIGQVPEHWGRSRIKFAIDFCSAGVWGNDPKNDGNDVVCFRAADFDYKHGCVNYDKVVLRNILPNEMVGRELQRGDLLIEKSGGGEQTPVGRVVLNNYDGKAVCSNFLQFARVKDDVQNHFLLYYFAFLYANNITYLFFNQTTGLQNLKTGEYLSQSIFLPPLQEQQAIASYLDSRTAALDAQKAKSERRIALLNELKQSIITEAVTGKVKIA